MTRIGMVLGTIGGIGAGWTFAISTPLMLDYLGLSLLPWQTGPMRPMDFIPLLLIAAAALTAMFAGRFGWVVTGVGAVGAYVLREIDLSVRTEASVTAHYAARSVAQGIVLGGALAAFGAADRSGRRVIAPGLAAGSVGGVYLTFAVADASDQAHLEPQVARILTYAPLALCVVAAIGTLILLVRRRDTGTGATGPDWVLPAASVVAAGGAIVCVGLTTTEPSQGLYVAAAAAIVIAAVTAWRAGLVAAGWAVVGYAAGSATTIDELVTGGRAEAAPLAAAAVGGVLLGTLLARFIAKVPWEAIALVGVAAALLASQPPSLSALAEGRTQYPAGPLTAVALVGLAIAAMLVRVGDRTPELRTAAAAGFASFVVAGVLAAPMSGFILIEDPVWDRRAIAIGVAGLAVLVLHLVGATRHERAASA